MTVVPTLKDSLVLVLVLLIGACSRQPAYEGKSIGELRQMLTSGDPSLRASAAHGLGLHGEEAAAALEELTRAAEDDDPLVKMRALDALGEIGPAAAPALPALIRGLDDTDATIRRQAALSLGKMRSAAAGARAALEKASKDEVPFVAEAAKRALQEIGRPASETGDSSERNTAE